MLSHGSSVEQSKEEIEWEELAVKFDKISPESDELAYDQETYSVKNIAFEVEVVWDATSL